MRWSTLSSSRLSSSTSLWTGHPYCADSLRIICKQHPKRGLPEDNEPFDDFWASWVR